MLLPLEPTGVPGVYRRVVVYRVEGRQRKQAADKVADPGAIKLERVLVNFALTRQPWEGALGVCRNARAPRLRVRQECETRRSVKRQFRSTVHSAADGGGARGLLRWSATLAVAPRSTGH